MTIAEFVDSCCNNKGTVQITCLSDGRVYSGPIEALKSHAGKLKSLEPKIIEYLRNLNIQRFSFDLSVNGLDVIPAIYITIDTGDSI